MVFAVLSGIISALGGALQIASAFKTQSATTSVGSGCGSGLWKFYSNSAVGTRSMAASSCGEYISRLITRVMKEATPEMQQHTDDIIADLQDIKDFESYAWGDCDNMVNTVNYNKGAGTLFMYVYTFSPFIHETRGEAVQISTMRINCNMELAKDWMIVSKAKSSFFKASVSQEIQYLPEKGLDVNAIVNAISIAMAPAVLGLVKLPDRFMTVLDSLLKEQMENPDKGVITAPTAEQTQAAYQQFQDMRTAQDNYEKNAETGFANLTQALKDLGTKGKDLPADG